MITRTQYISRLIVEKIASVSSVNGWAFNDAAALKVAVDHVLGAGTYDRIVSEVYDELRKA